MAGDIYCCSITPCPLAGAGRPTQHVMLSQVEVHIVERNRVPVHHLSISYVGTITPYTCVSVASTVG